MKKGFLIAALFSLALAILVPAGLALKFQSRMASYPEIRVDIEPYDPRDLLYGHYMTFRINWNIKPAKDLPSDSCLCVGDGIASPEVSPIVCPAPSDVPPACAHVIRGGSYYGDNHYDIGINRYYVDEEFALPLEKLFRDQKEKFQIGLHIAPDGRVFVGKLYVGGKTLADYAAGHDGKIPEPKPAP